MVACIARGWPRWLSLLCLLLLSACQPSATSPSPASPPPTGGLNPPVAATEPARGVAAQTEPAARERFVLALPAPSGTFAWAYVAKEQGIFEKYALDVELPLVRGNQTVGAGIVSGSFDVGGASVNAIDANLQDPEIVLIAVVLSRLVASIYTKPEITRIAQLRGRTVATTQRGATLGTALEVVLDHSGMDLSAVDVVYAGDVQAALTVLLNGQADAAVLTAPSTVHARRAGMRELLNIAELNYPFVMGGLATSKRLLQTKADQMERFLKAVVEAILYAKTHKAETMRAIGLYAQAADPDAQEESYNAHVPYFANKPFPTDEAIRNVLSLRTDDARTAPPGRFYDDTILRQLDRAGWLDHITNTYGRAP
jgi:ABC-type nitrate/sulfonate/bicarbonate transport system substrate-binding protein